MAYQYWHPGDPITAKNLNGVGWNLITQGVDAVYTSQIVPQGTNITFIPEPNSVYAYELFLAYTAHATPDLAWNWDAPQSLFCRYTLSNNAAAAADTGTVTSEPGSGMIFRRPANSTIIPAGGTGDTANGLCVAYDRGTFATTGTLGPVTLQCCQLATSANATRLRADTQFLYQRIG